MTFDGSKNEEGHVYLWWCSENVPLIVLQQYTSFDVRIPQSLCERLHISGKLKNIMWLSESKIHERKMPFIINQLLVCVENRKLSVRHCKKCLFYLRNWIQTARKHFECNSHCDRRTPDGSQNIVLIFRWLQIAFIQLFCQRRCRPSKRRGKIIIFRTNTCIYSFNLRISMQP